VQVIEGRGKKTERSVGSGYPAGDEQASDQRRQSGLRSQFAGYIFIGGSEFPAHGSKLTRMKNEEVRMKNEKRGRNGCRDPE
jgi:hypothetical protein